MRTRYSACILLRKNVVNFYPSNYPAFAHKRYDVIDDIQLALRVKHIEILKEANDYTVIDGEIARVRQPDITHAVNALLSRDGNAHAFAPESPKDELKNYWQTRIR